jgi:hypothetical protein
MEIRSLLKDVQIHGAVAVNKRKLLFLINNWSQDRPGAWRELLDHWEHLGRPRHSLKSVEAGEMIVLLENPVGQLVNVSTKEVV